MKKHLTNNLLTSGAILMGLLFVSVFVNYAPLLYYFLVVLFFLLIYTIKSILLIKLGTTPQRFLMIYNFMTVLKMLISIGFLVVCFFLLGDVTSNSDKIYFSLFFIALYFLFLIINTKSFFSNDNETAGK
mgnify:CR=1 FL=1